MASHFTSPLLNYRDSTMSGASGSTASLLDPPSRYGSPAPSQISKYSFGPDPPMGKPSEWYDAPEEDDHLHNPDPKQVGHGRGHIFTARGIANLGFLLVLALGIMVLFAGYPLYSHYTAHHQTTQGAFGLGGTNATGQVPVFPNFPGLIDIHTPAEAYTKASFQNPGDEWDLVFSDEFEVDGRSFFPGDDPFWEAVDLWYWGTNDLEWYDPKQVSTKDGYLRLTLDTAEPSINHNQSYISGMVQSWNKFCFTGGLIEVSVQLPGTNSKPGLWPAIWTMGNLGRAGFGASLDGMWPYTYDACDVGTLPNQTYPGEALPEAAVTNGDPDANNMLSYLSGQRLSACTCPGEPHPGPTRSNGSYVGRAAPEIDIFEALANSGFGQVSQSAQWAPFNAAYELTNTTENVKFYDPNVAEMNGYIGGSTQQTTSGLVTTNQDCYELEKGCFSVYGFEYKPGFDDAYITWIVNDTAAWTLEGAALGPDALTEISARPVPQEPVYIIANLGISKNFAHNLDPSTLTFPTTMLVDYVRVYQPKGSHNVGCNPADFPTTDYIETFYEAYTNPNLTLWGTGGYGQQQPKNRLKDTCST